MRHGISVAKPLLVHHQQESAFTDPHSYLRPKLLGIARFAEKLLVLVSDGRAVQPFAAHCALETGFVPFTASTNRLKSMVNVHRKSVYTRKKQNPLPTPYSSPIVSSSMQLRFPPVWLRWNPAVLSCTGRQCSPTSHRDAFPERHCLVSITLDNKRNRTERRDEERVHRTLHSICTSKRKKEATRKAFDQNHKSTETKTTTKNNDNNKTRREQPSRQNTLVSDIAHTCSNSKRTVKDLRVVHWKSILVFSSQRYLF